MGKELSDLQTNGNSLYPSLQDGAGIRLLQREDDFIYWVPGIIIKIGHRRMLQSSDYLLHFHSPNSLGLSEFRSNVLGQTNTLEGAR